MRTWVMLFVTALSFLVFSAAGWALVPIGTHQPPRAVSGEEPELLGPRPVATGHGGGSSLDDPIGDLYAIGTTYFDLQHNGSAGKMIGVDDSGYVHVTWMRGYDSGNADRHVWYNVWDPSSETMILGMGSPVDAATRAGFATLAVTPTGWGFPCFHQILPAGPDPHTAGAMDFMPRTGSFTVTEPDYLNAQQLIWPNIVAGPDQVLHVVSSKNAIPYDVFYSRGVPDFEGQDVILWDDVAPNQQYLLVGSSGYVSADIAASQVSNRLAIVWTAFRSGSQDVYNSDVHYKTSDDGGLTWNNEINLTNFAVQDTHRAFADASVIFDYNDDLHIAFTTSFYDEGTSTFSLQKGRIWHWSEADDSINAVADNWTEGPAAAGNVRRNVCRPSLACDSATGYIYCAYEWYNPASWSTSLYYNSDAFVSVSTDNGMHWSVGRNVTNTTPAQQPSPAGSCLSEREITLANPIHYRNGAGYLDLEWELDRDAGSGASTVPEGVVTLDTLFFQRVPVDSIPTEPLMPHFAFRFGEEVNPERRCCYGDSTQPDCANLTSADCQALGGDWNGNLTCATPCPVAIICTCQDEPNTHCNLTGATIPDGNGNGVNVTITVPQRYHITDVNVCLDVTHPQVSDLIISLRSPANTLDQLYTFGATGADMSCTTFDDEASGPIGQGSPPYNDSFQPIFPLSDFDGEIAEGNWTLNIADAYSGHAGTLNWVCVTFTYDYIDLAADDVPAVPTEYSLSAYPNPFNPTTTLRFGLVQDGRVTIDVFNVDGQRVEALVDKEFAAGYHAVAFDASRLPSGIYFAKIQAGSFGKTEKMVLMK